MRPCRRHVWIYDQHTMERVCEVCKLCVSMIQDKAVGPERATEDAERDYYIKELES